MLITQLASFINKQFLIIVEKILIHRGVVSTKSVERQLKAEFIIIRNNCE